MSRVRIAVLAVAGATVVAAGCGGTKQTPAANYVHQVCSAVSSYEANVTAVSKPDSSKIQAAISTKDFVTVKAVLTSVLNVSESQLKAAKRAVDKAGQPKVDGGAEIATKVSASFQQGINELGTAEQNLTSIDATNKTTFESQLSSLITTLGATNPVVKSLTSTDTLGSPSLQPLLAKDAACRMLASTGASPAPSTTPSAG